MVKYRERTDINPITISDTDYAIYEYVNDEFPDA